MNETEFYAALTLIAASAGSALTVGYLAERKADMFKATIVLLVGSLVMGVTGLPYRDQSTDAREAMPPTAAPATGQAPPIGKRYMPPPRRCSMIAYLVV